MEPEELKSAWQSVSTHIRGVVTDESMARLTARRLDAKGRLQKNMAIETIFMAVCLLLMLTSGWWATITIPAWLTAAICSAITLGICSELCLLRDIRQIDLSAETITETFRAVIRIKRLYRNLELIYSIIMAALVIWLSLLPPFIHSWRMVFAWCLLAIAMVAEGLLYRRHGRLLSSLCAPHDGDGLPEQKSVF